jgi:CheY-like chemotaxis protein
VGASGVNPNSEPARRLPSPSPTILKQEPNMHEMCQVTILLVEDNPGHARLIEKNLRRSNVTSEIQIASDGQQALDFLFGENQEIPRFPSSPSTSLGTGSLRAGAEIPRFPSTSLRAGAEIPRFPSTSLRAGAEIPRFPSTSLRAGAEIPRFARNDGSTGRKPLPPLLMLLDLNLPVIDGFQVLRRVKTDDRTKHIPVIVFTTTDDRHEATRCYDLGCNAYITKPVNYRQFSETIHRIGLLLSIATIPDGG